MNFLDAYKHSRRTFIGSSTGLASATLIVNFLDSGLAEAKGPEDNSARVQTLDPGTSWSEKPGKARHRYDGMAKVTGRKIYGRDFRSADMQGWPQEETRVVILRTNSADHIFLGVDDSRLKKELKVFT